VVGVYEKKCESGMMRSLFTEMKKIFLIILALLFVTLTGCSQDKSGAGKGGLSKEFLLSVAATTTATNVMKATGAVCSEHICEIPQKFWEKQIRDLKPIKVYKVRNSYLAVVLKVVDGAEEGKYIYLSYSSMRGFPCGSYGFVCQQDMLSEVGDFKRWPNNNPGEGDQCASKQDCAFINCLRHNNPSKSGYQPDCVNHLCKCMCYGCK
jgi:hypothetical protein